MERKSIMTSRLDICYLCGNTREIEIHHAIHGTANRQLSEKYDLVIGLCHGCHCQLHDSDVGMDNYVKAQAQRCFEIEHPHLSFRQIFGKNFVY